MAQLVERKHSLLKNTLTREKHLNRDTRSTITLSTEKASTRFKTMSLTAEERMARFIAMPKDRALNGYRAHKGKKTKIIKELAQHIGDVRALATSASVRLLNEKHSKGNAKTSN